jgi:hypothetical protein
MELGTDDETVQSQRVRELRGAFPPESGDLEPEFRLH